MEILDAKKAYKPPRVKVVEVNVQGVLCESQRTDGLTINDYGEEEL